MSLRRVQMRLATTYMILGPDAAEDLASRQGQAVYFIYKSGGDGFEDYVSSDEFEPLPWKAIYNRKGLRMTSFSNYISSLW